MSGPTRPGFVSYMLAVFVPPLYFFSRKRIFAGLFSLISLFVAIPFFFVFGFGMFIWIVMALWAVVSVANEAADHRAQDQADRIAAAMDKRQQAAE